MSTIIALQLESTISLLQGVARLLKCMLTIIKPKL